MVDYMKATSELLDYKQFEKLSYRDKVDLFFVDYNFIPLLIQDSYLSGFESNWGKSNYDIIRMAQASDFLSLGDNVSNQIMGNQQWTLLPDLALTHVIAPCHFAQGEVLRPSPFPQYFAKLSTEKKAKRLIRELKQSLG